MQSFLIQLNIYIKRNLQNGVVDKRKTSRKAKTFKRKA